MSRPTTWMWNISPGWNDTLKSMKMPSFWSLTISHSWTVLSIWSIIWKTKSWIVMWVITITSRRFMRSKKRRRKLPITVSSRRSVNWRISWHETKPVWQPETWLCHGRRSWIRWMWSSLRKKNQSRNFISALRALRVVSLWLQKNLWSAMKNRFPDRWPLRSSVAKRSCSPVPTESEKQHS